MLDDPGRSGPAPDLSHIRTRQQFADELTTLRERAGLTVRAVARATGIPAGTVGGYFGGRHLPTPHQVEQFTQVLAVCGVTDPVAVARWLDVLGRLRRTPGRRPAGAPVPYPGLASFQPGDADWFYGRETLTRLLLGRAADARAAGVPMIVVGSSGSGKSSLLRAGLIPALGARAAAPPRSGGGDGTSPAAQDGPPVVLLTPGRRPLDTLAEQVGSLLGEPPAPGAPAGRAAVAGLLRRWADGGGDEVVCVVDQFEEIFTEPCADDERDAFIDALCAVSGAATVVIGLRADFYSHALRRPELMNALQDHQLVVGPMTEAELRRAITEPALKANVEIEDGLVEILLRDLTPASGDRARAAHEPGALPLLAHVLRTTWERGRRARLTIEDYEDSGGIDGAVARTAEEVYASLGPARRRLARQIFLRLVHLADDTGDTRRRASREELAIDADARAVLDGFIERRLITVDVDQVEMAHEALLWAWPRLRTWITTDRAGLRVHRQLTSDAEAWRDSGRDPAVLYRGGRLATAREWAADPFHEADLNPLERGFLRASVEQETAEAAAARRRTRRLHRLLAALTVVSVLATLLAGYAFQQRETAVRQRDLAISRQVAVEAAKLRRTDPALAMQLSLAAYRVARTPEARASLLESFAGPAVTRVVGPPGVMQAVALSGRTMATAGADPAIRLWTMRGGRPVPEGRPLAGHTDTVFALAFAPRGDVLASGGADQTVRLWNLGGPGPIAPVVLPGAGGTARSAGNTVYSLAFSPDGRTLAAGSADHGVHLWDVHDPRRPLPLGAPLTGHTGFVQSVAFSPDGRTLASGGADLTVRLWDVRDPRRPVPLGRPLTGARRTVFAVAFSPDGRTLAAGGADTTVRLWRLDDRRRPVPAGPPLTGPASFVNAVAFAGDGRTLAAGSSDGMLWLWDVAGRHVVATLPHPGPVTAVAAGPGGRTVVTAAADGVARVWAPPGPVIAGPTKPVFSTVPDATGRVLAVVAADDTARLWNVADPRRPVPLGPAMTRAAGDARSTGAGGLSPDARTLAVGQVDGGVRLWDLTRPSRPVPIPRRLTGPASNVEGVTFSPDGRILAVSDDDGTVSLWNVADPRRPVRPGPPVRAFTNYAYYPAFSPDGRTLAVGSADRTVRLWDVGDPRRPVPLGAPLRGHSSYVFTVAFSPDGRTLATGGADDRVRLWDLTRRDHPMPVGPVLTGPKNYVFSVAFSADGRTLAASAGDGTTWLWDVSDRRRPTVGATLTGPSGAVFTNAYDPRRPVLVTSGADEKTRLWDTDPEQVARYVCRTAGTPIARGEWREYVPGRGYRPPCPGT